MGNTKIEIGVHELRDLVAGVIPLADTGTGLPVLECVLLRGHGDQITATATDRYRIGISRVDVQAPDGFRALVRAVDLKAILKTFRPTRNTSPTLTLDFDDGYVSVSSTGSMIDFAGATIRYRLDDGEFPKADSIVASDGDTVDIPAGTAFNPKFLGGFDAARRSPADPLVIRAIGHPMATRMQLSIGDYFVGALMSMRAPSSSGRPWPIAFGEPEAEPKAAS